MNFIERKIKEQLYGRKVEKIVDSLRSDRRKNIDVKEAIKDANILEMAIFTKSLNLVSKVISFSKSDLVEQKHLEEILKIGIEKLEKSKDRGINTFDTLDIEMNLNALVFDVIKKNPNFKISENIAKLSLDAGMGTFSVDRKDFFDMVLSKMDRESITPDLIKKIVLQSNPNVLEKTLKDDQDSYLSKELIDELIRDTGIDSVRSIFHLVPKKELDKDVLFTLMEDAKKHNIEETFKTIIKNTKDKKVIQKVEDALSKLSSEDRNDINTDYMFKFNSIIKNFNKDVLDKEVLLKAMLTKSSNLVNALIWNSSENLIESNLGELAAFYNDKNRGQKLFLRSVDNLDISDEKKDKIYNIVNKDVSYNNPTSLVKQVFSLEGNDLISYKNQITLMDTYVEMLKDNIQNGFVPKEFPIHAFNRDIEKSKEFFKSSETLSLDYLDSKDKILLLPVYSNGHFFTGAVREDEKTDKISVTLINLGDKTNYLKHKKDENGNYSAVSEIDPPYMEFVMTREKAQRVLLNHKNPFPNMIGDKVTKVYSDFRENSEEVFRLKLTSKDQKTGNCYIKNIEKGLKFLVSSRLSRLKDEDFSMDRFRAPYDPQNYIERGVETLLKPKAMKPFCEDKNKEKGITNTQSKLQFADKIAWKFPQNKAEIEKSKKEYKKGKKDEVELTM